ncbi:MAG TPA: hypothetical protein VK454_02355 [Myxococcaceae bacterium]|nr:hypothetical protein [Myxococcaceae bacterium]
MLFRKLFQVLVLGGAVVGSATGCSTRADAQTKPAPRDGGAAADAGTAGGGVKGW